MSASLALPVSSEFSSNQELDNVQIKKQIRTALHAVLSATPPIERRLSGRHPFPYPITITPMSEDGHAVPQERFTVIGRHLSEMGVDFYHSVPIPYRNVIATLTSSRGQRLDLVIALTWCRFRQHGIYENGGRFLKLIKADG